MATHNLEQRKKEQFLKAFSETGNICKAADIAHINRERHYTWLKCDPDYPKLFDAAEVKAGDTLEAEAVRRAYEGIDEPVFYRGEACGTVRKYSDTLLIFLLKGAKPEKYKERSASTLSNPDGTNLVIKVVRVGGGTDRNNG